MSEEEKFDWFKDNTKLDRIWLDSSIHQRRDFCNRDHGSFMDLDDAKKLFFRGKELERMIKELKLHCIKNNTASYDENGDFRLTEEEDSTAS